ncbi:uncharacterized protein LOC126894741 isoform X2 [Daktulosphaira vitifoliae]|uniref:uncharacterized protein LOC126894741 isoform X2 n=1 Tax=Daktulosphaira vitifoliae TaxID=58002 RepID=UPI0021AA8C61|nr:uncharacterized protein LOC126894741 isoform X2 [Daktulosphaira vitifoliae]
MASNVEWLFFLSSIFGTYPVKITHDYTKVSKLLRLSLLKCILALYWIVIILYLDPDPVILIRIKAQHLETGSGPKATVLFLVTKYLKSLIIIIHAIKSIDILNIINDVRLLEERINCKAPKYYTGIAALVGVLFTIFEVIFDYQWQSLSTPKWIFYLEGISRVCLFSIDLQFFDLCIRAAAMYKKLNKNLILVYRFKKTIQHNKGIENLSKTNMEFMNLNKISTKINQSYSSQLFLIVGLHFYSVLVNVYLFVFHTFALGIPWTVILNLRFLNTLWRLNIICGAAHYTVNQALHVYRKLGQLRTSCVGPKDIEEIEIIFFQYNVENLSFTLFGIMKLDFSLMLLPSFGHVPRPDGPVLEEYRLRSFSITASGVCNLGDFVRYAPPTATTSSQHLTISKRDSSPASVSSSPLHQNIAAAAHTVCTEFSRFRKPSTALISKFKANDTVESYKVALLGAPGVGKTTISVQFSTSEYICVYDTSIDEDCACRTIRVMINGQEAELTIIDIPYKEMSIETLCSTYNPNVFIVMYSIVDERSFDIAEQMLLFLWKGEYIHTKGVILVGNKSDLERTRRIQTNVGRSLAFSWNCKFIETSGGIDHNVDKLLVGILAQIKLNPLRERMYNSKRKKYSVTRLYKNFLAALRGVKSSENLFSI